MKSLLILTPRYPYPVIGGDRLRIYHLCKELSKTFRLTLLSLCETKEELQAETPKDGIFHKIERVYLPRWRSFINCAAALPTRLPLQVAYYQSPDFTSALRRLAPLHDGCLGHLIRTGENLVAQDVRPRFLEMTDAISLNYARLKEAGRIRSFKAAIFRLEAKRLLKYERRIAPLFDLVSLVSQTDVDFLGIGGTNTIVCSNGVDLEGLPFSARTHSKPVLAFIGNMTTVQNLDACHRFAREVLPLLRQRLDCTFRIVGKIGASDAAQFLKYHGVEVTGAVDSIPEAVSDARAGVCPIQVGAGVQNKVLEYMALGLPTITSSVGLEGFSAIPNRDVLVADSADEYLKHVSTIWENKEYSAIIAQNGRKYVQGNHDWHAMLKPLVSRVADVLSRSCAQRFKPET